MRCIIAIIIGLVIVIISLLQDYNEISNIEHYDNEAIHNIKSVFNADDLRVSNLNITGNLTQNSITLGNENNNDNLGNNIVFLNTNATPQDYGNIDFYNVNTNSENRKARIRALNTNVNNVNRGRLDIGSAYINLFANKIISKGQLTMNGARNRGSLYGDGKTHFNHHSTGDNFIRGDTNIEGHLRLTPTNQLCIGGFCLSSDDFKKIINVVENNVF